MALWASSLHPRHNSLPRRLAFAPFLHEQVMGLAGDAALRLSLPPAASVAVGGPDLDLDGAEIRDGALRIENPRAGLHRFVVPEAAREAMLEVLTPDGDLAVALTGDPDETAPQVLDDGDWDKLADRGIRRAEDLEELQERLRGTGGGRDLAAPLAMFALLLLVGEVGLARWRSRS